MVHGLRETQLGWMAECVILGERSSWYVNDGWTIGVENFLGLYVFF